MKKYIIFILFIFICLISNAEAKNYTYYVARGTYENVNQTKVDGISSDGLRRCQDYFDTYVEYCYDVSFFKTSVYKVDTIYHDAMYFSKSLVNNGRFAEFNKQISSSCDALPDGAKYLFSKCATASVKENNTYCSSMGKNTCTDNGCYWSSQHGCTVQNMGESAGNVEATCTGMLGSFKDDIQSALDAMRIAGPCIVFALSVYEYIMALVSKDAEKMKTCNTRLFKRLALIVILFLAPTLVNIIMNLIDANYTNCVK